MGRVQDTWDDQFSFGGESLQPAQPVEQEKPPALSVSAAMQLAKGALENVSIRLVGEVSEVSNKPGYKAVYFTVKDQAASLPCMMWQNRYKSSGVDMRVGQLVELTGRFTLYAAKGRMNFDVFSLTLAGEGNLRMQVAQLARKLEAEGLTDAQRKRALPLYPQRIGVVTSPRGAAVHDVLRTLRRRFPVARVLLAGVAVEGASAAKGIVAGIDCVCQAGAEVVLVVRGGGSFEDLMPFNDEQLARAIAACPVPVVTGIGHEPDTSIADLVADRRASTPTAAAEAVSPGAAELRQTLDASKERLHGGLSRRLERSRLVLQRYADRPLMKDPAYLYAAEAQALDHAAARLSAAIPNVLARDKASLALSSDRLKAVGKGLVGGHAAQMAVAAARLQDLSPLTILGRGYAIARSEDGAVVGSVRAVEPGDNVTVSVSDGSLQCRVTDILPASGASA
ncbi:MAG: exodeoxyribonuclease VII large subunit [Coriobacteriia bacterium]|nr:exodeoxyribonuclease VII large subunit [Coriobacteriia bacterium]